MWDQELYSQHFIFFVTCKWDQQGEVLQYIRLEGLPSEKHSRLERLASNKPTSLMGPFISYEEIEVLWIVLQES